MSQVSAWLRRHEPGGSLRPARPPPGPTHRHHRACPRPPLCGRPAPVPPAIECSCVPSVLPSCSSPCWSWRSRCPRPPTPPTWTRARSSSPSRCRTACATRTTGATARSGGRRHLGVDIMSDQMTPVFAAQSGTIYDWEGDCEPGPVLQLVLPAARRATTGGCTSTSTSTTTPRGARTAVTAPGAPRTPTPRADRRAAPGQPQGPARRAWRAPGLGRLVGQRRLPRGPPALRDLERRGLVGPRRGLRLDQPLPAGAGRPGRRQRLGTELVAGRARPVESGRGRRPDRHRRRAVPLGLPRRRRDRGDRPRHLLPGGAGRLAARRHRRRPDPAGLAGRERPAGRDQRRASPTRSTGSGRSTRSWSGPDAPRQRGRRRAGRQDRPRGRRRPTRSARRTRRDVGRGRRGGAEGPGHRRAAA